MDEKIEKAMEQIVEETLKDQPSGKPITEYTGEEEEGEKRTEAEEISRTENTEQKKEAGGIKENSEKDKGKIPFPV